MYNFLNNIFLLVYSLNLVIFIHVPVLCKAQDFKFLSSSSNIKNYDELKNVLSRRNHNPASYLTTPEVIQSYGYVSESHKVITEDGYILTMHRIPFGKNEKNSPKFKRPIVFLQHGLFASSYEWFMNTPDKLLALRLSDAGYDVWLGNARGNAYSREHTKMTVRDRNFWEFSMHEMGKYDLPAELNYILNHTSSQKLTYIGFSMGTSMFWIMLSSNPQFNEKIKFMTALAPVVYINNMKGFPRILLAPFIRVLKFILDLIGNGEFLPPTLLRAYNRVGRRLCSNTFIAETICANINFLYAGWDLPQTQINQLPLFYANTPSPTSTRTLSHISQLINKGLFQEYDFGMRENYLRYKSPVPPKYNLENTKVPVALLWGPNDAVVDPIDVRRLEKELPNLVLSQAVNFTLWNHFDYHLGRDVNELVNEPLLKLIGNYN